MEEFHKFHKILTASQVTVALLSLSVASLGVVIKHHFIVYFWYLALCCMVMMLLTSFLIGIVLLLKRVFDPFSSRGKQGWLSETKGIHI